MAKLDEELNSRKSKIRRELRKPPEFPEWWPLAQIVVAAFVVVGLLWAFVFRGDSASEVVLPPAPPVAPVGPPTTQPPVVDPVTDLTLPTDTVAPPPVTGDLVVNADGTPAEVPEAALNRVRGMLRALGTDNAEFVQFVVMSQQEDRITFDVRWIPAGEPETTTSVTVRRDVAGVWLPS